MNIPLFFRRPPALPAGRISPAAYLHPGNLSPTRSRLPRYLTLLFCLALLVPLASLMVGALEPAQAAKARIHGTVRLNDGDPGTPLANIQVKFWRRDGVFLPSAVTGSDGYFCSGEMDDLGVGFNVAFNKPNRDGAMPGEPGLNAAYTYEETSDVYLSSPPSDGKVVVNANLNLTIGPGPAPGPAPAPVSDLYGICINVNRADQNPPADDVSDLGARWVRTIKYHGTEIVPRGNVKWLVIYNQESIPLKPGETWEMYANRFAHEVKNHVAANPWIRGVEVWNEPDLSGSHLPHFYPTLSEKEYAVLLRATYLKLKELPNPPLVISAGLCTGTGNAVNYIRTVRSFWGGPVYCDGVGFHPYGASPQGIGADIAALYEASGGRQVWLTEFGRVVQSFGGDTVTAREEAQGAYLDGMFRAIAAQKDGTRPKVGVAFWFAWDDRTHGNATLESFGLVRPNWQVNLQDPQAYRRPAWYRYLALSRGPVTAPGQAVFTDGMESGTGRWSGYLVTLAKASTPRHNGSLSMKTSGKGPVYQVKDGKKVSGGSYVTSYPAVSPNTKYEVSAWVYSPDSTHVEANLYIQQYRGTTHATKIKDAADAFRYDQYMARTVNRNSGWQKLAVTFTTHVEARYIDPSLCTRETGKTVYWDDVQIRKI